MRQASRSVVFWPALLCAAAPLPAVAAGFAVSEQSGSGLGSSFAGQAAMVDDASVIFYNPAGMAMLPKRQVVVAGHYLSGKSTFDDSGSCAPYGGIGAGTSTCPFGPAGNLGHTPGDDGGEVSDPAFIPNLYGSWELMPNQLWLGLGVNAPFGLAINRDPNWIGRFHGIESEAKSININPSLAWKLSNQVSVGAGVNLQRFEVDLSNALSYYAVALGSGVPDLIAAVPAGSEGVVHIKGDDWSWGWNVGAMITPMETVRVGVAYRSAIRHSLQGNVRFDDRPAALGAVPNVADGDISADVKLPDTVSVAAAWQVLPQLTLMADWARTGWDSIQDLDIMRNDGPLAGTELSTLPLRLKDTWRAGIGAVWRVDNQWSLRTGYAHDTSAVVDTFRSPRLPDNDRDWFALGARYTPAPAWSLDFSLAFVRTKDAASDLPNQDDPTTPPRGSLVGTYKGDATIFALQLNYGF